MYSAIFELNAKGDTTILTYTYDGSVFENGFGGLIQVCDSYQRMLL
jgi:hypothetical protein